MEEESEERSLALTPTWSVASVLSTFVAVSLLLERSIHHLTHWLQKTNRGPLLQAVEKMKEELMLLGFISLLLTASSSTISNICIESKLYNSVFAPCSRSDIDSDPEDKTFEERRLLMASVSGAFRRALNELNHNPCKKGHEPFVSEMGLEQLHRFIFILAVTHIAYSCLTMLLGAIKIHSWKTWEEQADIDELDPSKETAKESIMRRQSTFVRLHAASSSAMNNFMLWATCFFRQFGSSVVRADYLTLRKGFVMNHNLASGYDFHSYMVRSMEEEFQSIVGVSGPLWGFVVAFMLFNIHGSYLYFWMAIIPMALLLMVGTKLQNVIATLTLESAGVSGFYTEDTLRPRDDLFWFRKPELLLSLIHFILFQNAFELASFLWFWWQFGYRSCFMSHHFFVYLRLTIGFFGQFLCSYSTLPLYALVTQMGTNYKAAMIPQRVRETLHGWNKSARRKRRLMPYDDSVTKHTDSCSVESVEGDDDDEQTEEIRPHLPSQVELQKRDHSMVGGENTSRGGTHLFWSFASSAMGNTSVEKAQSSSSSGRGSPKKSDK